MCSLSWYSRNSQHHKRISWNFLTETHHLFPQVLFEHEGVFVHSSTVAVEDQDLLISGYLRVLDKVGHFCLGRYL